MASSVSDLLKICNRRSGRAAFRLLLQQSTQAAELQCRPHDDRCSRCWMSYNCLRATALKPQMLDQIPSARGLRTLCSMNQNVCKKYYKDGKECCSDEWVYLKWLLILLFLGEIPMSVEICMSVWYESGLTWPVGRPMLVSYYLLVVIYISFAPWYTILWFLTVKEFSPKMLQLYII